MSTQRSPDGPPNRDELATQYLESLPYAPYPVQEEALLAWFTSERDILVCAPTGMGKTVIGEAALYEALHTGATAYYTTPLIALTEQKFHELQAKAISWGFSESDVGLVTGNRRVNPDARVLIVVAEILFNRLLHREAFHFDDVRAVVMDEFHSFNDPERGVVWEFTLGLLPKHVRVLLLSATVGNAVDFTLWMKRSHGRSVGLITSDQRRVPLAFHWIGDRTLSEHLEDMARGPDEARRTPALVFCFNREQCWSLAELMKGKAILDGLARAALADELKQYDWTEGAGPKLKQILLRGVGVHHAGVLPKYRRIVESLFQRKMLAVTMCTETLAAGINLPCRSVVLPTLLKGPVEKKKLIEPSTAHQIFGRAGRPQFDDRGFVYALAHEDDVKLLRWREKYDQIPEDTKDPGLRKAKKALKAKMPKRRANEQYWTESQFNKLREAPPGKLYSKGELPWRMLAHVLEASSDLGTLRELVDKRLMDEGSSEGAQKNLDRMLLTLWRAGYVTLEPKPPQDLDDDSPGDTSSASLQNGATSHDPTAGQPATANQLFGFSLAPASKATSSSRDQVSSAQPTAAPRYRPQKAQPTELLPRLEMFRSVHPLYGVFLINHLGIADEAERLQAMESVLELPPSVVHFLRVPKHEELPPGPLATMRLDAHLLQLGLVSVEQLIEQPREDGPREMFAEERVFVLTLAEKLKLLFDYDFPGTGGFRIQGVWGAGDLLNAYGGNFNKFVLGHRLQTQEGIVFRHLLRLVLLMGEFKSLTPPECDPQDWQLWLDDTAAKITESCRQVDPTSTEMTLAKQDDG